MAAGTTRTFAEFAPPGEPADDNRSQQHKDKLKQMNQDVLDKIAPSAIVIPRAHRLGDYERQYARQKHHERIDNALDQGHRHHVAVGDVSEFVTEHAFNLAPAH